MVAAPHIYDPRVGHWTFDTSSLRNLDAGHLLGVLATSFRGRVHLVAEVDAELPSTSPLRTSLIPWHDVMSVTLPAELTLYNLLRLRWGSAAGRDGGEAAAITLAAGHAFRFVCDDGVGFRAAASPEAMVCVMRTTTFVVAIVRAGFIAVDDGWAAVQAMLAAGRTWLGPVLWADRAGFDALCGQAGFDPCADAASPAPRSS